MDINVTLGSIRDSVELIECGIAEHDGSVISDVLTLLGEIRALDEWLSRGGFLPDAWNVDRS